MSTSPFPCLFFFSSFRQTVNSKLFNKIWLWLNSNPGTRVSEVTALSTVPQHWWPDNGLKSSPNFSKLQFLLNKWCFKNTPKVTKHLGYFWKMICHYGLSKIAQSGKTGHTTFGLSEGCAWDSSKYCQQNNYATSFDITHGQTALLFYVN